MLSSSFYGAKNVQFRFCLVVEGMVLTCSGVFAFLDLVVGASMAWGVRVMGVCLSMFLRLWGSACGDIYSAGGLLLQSYSCKLVHSRDLSTAMPGFYQHGILSRAIRLAGQSGRPIPAGRREQGRIYEDAGTLLYLSTASQILTDYDVYYSDAELSFGPFHQSWAYAGAVGAVYPMMAGTTDPTLPSILQLCGANWAVFVIYAFANYQGYVDVYVKRFMSLPPDRYAHYSVYVSSPELWWSAREMHFNGVVSMPHWVEMPPMTP